MNVKKGLPPDEKVYYTHDPVWVKISVVNDKMVEVNEKGDPYQKIPNINFSF